MKNQRGVTLVELLVVILIMGAIFAPISMMVKYSLETEKDVSGKNDVQREARFIMEYITDKMRNKDVYWYEDGENWILCKYDYENLSCPNPLLTYDFTDNTSLKSTGGKILSNNIILTLSPGPFDPYSATVQRDIQVLNTQAISVKVTKFGEEITLESNVSFNRFK